MINFSAQKELVRKQGCFSKLSDSELAELAELFKPKNFNKDEIIVNEGDPVDSVYLIIKGTADVKNLRLKDNTTYFESVAILGPGQSIGLNETGFYSISGRRTATVVALTDMETLVLSIAAFHGFALAYPHVSEVMRMNAMAFMDSETRS